jgi:hypothetical protein
MKKSVIIITIISAILLIGLTGYCMYRYTKCENYRKLKFLGNFPLDVTNMRGKFRPSRDSPEDKYDSYHRYKGTPYNKNGQQRTYS